MSRDDDPEARIRELERAMNEQAQASELTQPGQQWAAAAPVSSRPYPNRYQPPRPPLSSRQPQPPRPGFPARRLFFAAFLIAGL
ncbi:MAG: hypothetical protein P4L86_18235, partial [Mycobacterium sp.]|nr:hypothetical protein [Mycobacterium sp.]